MALIFDLDCVKEVCAGVSKYPSYTLALFKLRNQILLYPMIYFNNQLVIPG
jgi:hypothetical protein